MKTQTELTLWDEARTEIVPKDLTDASEIAKFAKQLSDREKNQVVVAYQNKSFEMATSFVWGRAMASLKRELGALGVTFLGELLGRTDIDEDDNVLDVITEKEAIKLAEELGVVSRTDAMRLRHAQELVSHFSQRDPNESDEQMGGMEAGNILLYCVSSVLAKPSIQVAQKFADFRKRLETETLAADDSRCDTLVASPYFFRRLALAVLLSGIRTNTGAKLEHCLANINVLLPLLWSKTREPERWQVGKTYAQVYADGLQVQTAGLKKALLKVKGFDFVPENIRSQNFIRAAEAIIQAHEGMNNFYNEAAPVFHLEKLGTVIPAPAMAQCITALLCVSIGNRYGISWSAKPTADLLLKKQGADRWIHYFNNVLPGETRILEKLLDANPQTYWIEFMSGILTDDMTFKNKNVTSLLEATLEKKENRIAQYAQKLLDIYYTEGKSQKIYE